MIAAAPFKPLWLITKYFMSRQEQLLAKNAYSGVRCHPMWPSYRDVMAFLRSPNCLAIYTDSGGLQEEANILGIPCMTCRYSTERPETILDCSTNLLIPPDSTELVYRGIEYCLENGHRTVWRNLGQNLYGQQVAASIVDHMSATLSIQ
jgi:UDP-N-acetylglucosamine 2-epimerase (non-hydrolysing)